MAGTSLFALLDDIAAVLDDVSVLTQAAAKKTAGVLGDDLALNAEQVTGVRGERELPVVWKVAKGSAINKAILVPVALGISQWAHFLIAPLLMVGGAYLCFEGFEKVAHALARRREGQGEDEERKALREALLDPEVDMAAFESEKIKGAIRTDFVLSAEIIAITLGVVSQSPFITQVGVLVGIAAAMTIGVYGLVAAIVKLDDAGLRLSRAEGSGGVARALRGLGAAILSAAPYLMKFLSLAGTTAMFLVGGGILMHGIPPLSAAVLRTAEEFSPLLSALVPTLANGLVGLIAGGVLVAIKSVVQRLRTPSTSSGLH